MYACVQGMMFNVVIIWLNCACVLTLTLFMVKVIQSFWKKTLMEDVPIFQRSTESDVLMHGII